MISKKEPSYSDQDKSDNGANELIDELRAIMGVYAQDVKLIREGKDGKDGSALTLLGKKGSDATFQKVMALVDRETKIKSLGKDLKPVKASETAEAIPDAQDEIVPDNTPKVRSIQDFALAKKKA